jgi:hypothetical protein
MAWEVKQMLAEDRPKTRTSLLAPEAMPIAPAPPTAPPKVSPLVMTPVISWEKLPDDFILPDDPVDNIHQPSIAAGLTESILLAELLPENALICTDYGVIATVDGKTIAKAPDWAYIANITVPMVEVNKSYTPHLQGDVPTIVLEFLSDTDGTEYSSKPDNPMGKWYYYERVLKVPYYGIFEPESGDFQVYVLGESGSYDRLAIEESGRYWIEPMQLSIAAWKGSRQNRTGWWLRWWDASGTMLPWANEKVAQERQRAEEERQRAEEERQRADVADQRADAADQRADRLAQRLKELGLDPEGDV